MKLLILYFSGTGNTHYIAKYIYTHLNSMDFHAEIVMESIETLHPENVSEYDLVCFGFPVFALGAPEIVNDYLVELKSVENIGLFLFCTMGLAAGNAFRRVFKLFEPKGYRFLGATAVLMPGTDGLSMMDKNSKYIKKALNKNYDLIPRADELVQEIAIFIQDNTKGEQLDINKNQQLPFKIADFLLGWSFRLLYVILVIFMKKKYNVDTNCNRCGLCVQFCPKQNITLEKDGIHFSNKCIICLRCIHQCPQQAVQIGSLTKGKFRWSGPKGNFKPLKIIKNSISK
ncbi:MAG: hypothetical protein GY870_22170 [archaeon]|nr:hypothetical protein [archaeon]